MEAQNRRGNKKQGMLDAGWRGIWGCEPPGIDSGKQAGRPRRRDAGREKSSGFLEKKLAYPIGLW